MLKLVANADSRVAPKAFSVEKPVEIVGMSFLLSSLLLFGERTGSCAAGNPALPFF
jgi:hypothetical protein